MKLRLLIPTLIFVILTMPAVDAFSDTAQSLNAMALFLGDDGGFRLGDDLTESEAAILVSRLGYADADVPTETSEASARMDARRFAALMLRVLGYGDADFTYDGALDFAMAIGLLDFANYSAGSGSPIVNDDASENLTRGNAATVVYTALSLPTVDGKYECLLERLVADGLVAGAAASETMDTFKTTEIMSRQSRNSTEKRITK